MAESLGRHTTIIEDDQLTASASGNQILTYDLGSVDERGHYFGSRPAASSAVGLMPIENEAGQIKIYDLSTSQLRRQYVSSDPASSKLFSADGKRLFVLTASQTVYILDLTGTH